MLGGHQPVSPPPDVCAYFSTTLGPVAQSPWFKEFLIISIYTAQREAFHHVQTFLPAFHQFLLYSLAAVTQNPYNLNILLISGEISL